MRCYPKGIGVARCGAVVAALAFFGNCSGSSGTVPSDAVRDRAGSINDGWTQDHPEDAGRDRSVAATDGSVGDQVAGAAAQGTPYACAGGFIVTADGGEVVVPDAGSPAVCVVGQTYCYIALPHPDTTGEATASCRLFDAGVQPDCARDPTCTCFCDLSRGGFHCQTECRCNETNGFATVSCQGI